MIAPEHRCSPYNRIKDYSYPQSVEAKIVKAMGNKIYSHYMDKIFESTKETDIDHIVSLSEAHDSGLCAMDSKTKKKFSSDIDNLTLATPHLNRNIKNSLDASGWLPDKNKCWFANKVLSIKRNYNLTVDSDELIALEKVLSNCTTSKISYNKVNTDYKLTANVDHNKPFPSVKKSKSGICHTRGSPHYNRIKNFTPFQDIKSCLEAKGRCAKQDKVCQKSTD